MIQLQADQNQIAKIKDKFEKFPPYYTNVALGQTADYLNDPAFKQSMYPPRSSEPFVWSSERMRRAYFATDGFGAGIPYSRTNELADSGNFRADLNRSSLYVYYENVAIYAKWVIGHLSQIIGHRVRGWKPPSAHVVEKRSDIVAIFKDAVARAWQELGQ